MSSVQSKPTQAVLNDVTLALRNLVPEIRVAALRAVQTFPPDPDQFCRHLIDLLVDANEVVCRESAISLAIHGTEWADSALLHVMFQGDAPELLRLEAANSFAVIGGSVEVATGAILPILSSQDLHTWDRANEILQRFGPRASLAAPVLIKVARELFDRSYGGPWDSKALFTLGSIGEPADIVCGFLAECLTSSNPNLCLAAAFWLPRIRLTKDALPHLTAVFDFLDPVTQTVHSRSLLCDHHELAARLLGELGNKATEAIPALEELCNRPNALNDAQRLQEAPFATEINRLKKIPSRSGKLRRKAEDQLRAKIGPLRLTTAKAQSAARKALQLIRS